MRKSSLLVVQEIQVKNRTNRSFRDYYTLPLQGEQFFSFAHISLKKLLNVISLEHIGVTIQRKTAKISYTLLLHKCGERRRNKYLSRIEEAPPLQKLIEK